MRWLRLIRVHQWAKNGLLLLPAVAAHLAPTGPHLATLALAVVSFCLLASAVYVLNDLADREHDRQHPTKRHRPLAAGEVGTGAALGLMAALAVASLALALTLPLGFLVAWTSYLVLTTSYSFLLKRVVVLDVVILAALYTVRVVAGAAALAIPLSRWFLAFSVFLFLSLALLKRLVEVAAVAEREGPEVGTGEPTVEAEPEGQAGSVPGVAMAAERGRTGAAGAEREVTPRAAPERVAGRGWRVVDLPLLRSLGVGSGVAAALVYCLYITDEQTATLYRHPDVLWIGLPLFLYGLARVWILANRGEVHEDPVIFALRDHPSHIVLILLVAMVVVAA